MTTKSSVNIALVGAGTVGQGLIKIMQSHLALLEEKSGAPLRLTWICDRDKKSLPRGPGLNPQFTSRWEDVVEDPAVDVVVELIGGYEPARTLVLAALKKGKHVATANKAMLAKFWGELFETAQQSKALLYFEAAVGGGIPVVQGLNEGLAANRIQKVVGILNGTTNYILTRMAEENLTFAAALKGAQKEGFAEADPSFDIAGTDAAHKIAILASLASGGWVKLEDVYREGIADLQSWDVAFAKNKLGLTVKLLALTDLEDDTISVRVHPALIPLSHPFANVKREYNAVIVQGDAADDVMFYGKGAGSLAAASAVMSDVIYLARQVASGTAGEIPYVAYHPHHALTAKPFLKTTCRHYLRFNVEDKPGALARLTLALGRNGISIASLHQEVMPESLSTRRRVPVVVLTHAATEGAVKKAIAAGEKRVKGKPAVVHLRLADL